MFRLPRLLLTACVLLAARPVAAEKSSDEEAAFIRKNEIKLVVAAENLAHARRVLKLEEQPPDQQVVCFFDTADGALRANHLILRARQDDGEAGESTVKLRAVPEGEALTEQELALPPEQDWTRADGPTLSRALDSDPLETGAVPRVIENGKNVISLFDPQQRALVTARIGDLDWSRLKRYGPIRAEVWKRQLKLDGFKGRVTVEIWHLKDGDRSQEILEISTKAKADSEIEARQIAKSFFHAAKTAGFGDPTGDTKTAKALEFYKPGR